MNIWSGLSAFECECEIIMCCIKIHGPRNFFTSKILSLLLPFEVKGPGGHIPNNDVK